ncbi:hypothetical protein DUI87_04841 [Hirundo rustica rustica]|uniref:Uncharacterized protein n=1 Tax=Hirundo rustica rustica TaxID=333673 RepID=A0A3M0LFT4_HIRRU|nr:hypothetical protein DUI87_04841 [Hirundo rustica rustica]
MGLLQQETGDLTDLDMEKDEILNEFYTSVFNRKCSSNPTQTEKKLKFTNWENEDPKPTMGKDQWSLLMDCNINKMIVFSFFSDEGQLMDF